MVYCIANNISSPLGWTTDDNFGKIVKGMSMLGLHEHLWGLEEPVMASLFEVGDIERRYAEIKIKEELLTRFEKLVVISVSDVLAQTGIDLADKETILVLSTTKGNIELLDTAMDYGVSPERVRIGKSAEAIAGYFNCCNKPITVSNACISGVSAMIVAMRLLESGQYKHAVVCGCDVLNKFIVSGFQSFKALSPEPCKPFDKNRIGLNLGEAAATVVLTSDMDRVKNTPWQLVRGAIRNDANHISGPSRTGEGSYRALRYAVQGIDIETLAFINAHGTATAYNDDMESIAISRAGMEEVPTNALKGYYGHTLGAAGVLECIISMQAIAHGKVLPTRGHTERGVVKPIKINTELTDTCKTSFVKMLSGFGGCNAALLLKESAEKIEATHDSFTMEPVCRVWITPSEVHVDGEDIRIDRKEKDVLTELYKNRQMNYPKFYKMDGLSRLGFVVTELLFECLHKRDIPTMEGGEECALIAVGRNGSLANDRKYQQTIQHDEDFFPSPAIFVYTLPNIVLGEIAIRHQLYGETTFFIAEDKDERRILELMQNSLVHSGARFVLGGWLDYAGENDFEADLTLYKKINSNINK